MLVQLPVAAVVAVRLGRMATVIRVAQGQVALGMPGMAEPVVQPVELPVVLVKNIKSRRHLAPVVVVVQISRVPMGRGVCMGVVELLILLPVVLAPQDFW